MKVKYWSTSNTLSCYNTDFEIRLTVHLLLTEGETSVLYDPATIVQFVDAIFLPSNVITTKIEYERLLRELLYPGCTTLIRNRVHVTMYALKYFFSGLVSKRVSEMSSCAILEQRHSKLINWLLKFDFDRIILNAHNILDVSEGCNFCQNVFSDEKTTSGFDGVNVNRKK